MTKIDLRATEDEKDDQSVFRNAIVQKTGAEIDTWIDANVTDLASAKTVLKLLTRGLRVVLRRQSK